MEKALLSNERVELRDIFVLNQKFKKLEYLEIPKLMKKFQHLKKNNILKCQKSF